MKLLLHQKGAVIKTIINIDGYICKNPKYQLPLLFSCDFKKCPFLNFHDQDRHESQ